MKVKDMSDVSVFKAQREFVKSQFPGILSLCFLQWIGVERDLEGLVKALEYKEN